MIRGVKYGALGILSVCLSITGTARADKLGVAMDNGQSGDDDADVLLAAPAYLTSDAPPETANGDAAADLSWLKDLVLPDFPIRWDARVVSYLEFYKNDPSGKRRMKALLEKANIYRDLVQGKLRTAGVPEDLFYVAMVESGFDPNVRSPAGAVGLWQFVEKTGSDYGLPVTRWIDTRVDPERATEGAAKFLLDLHNRLGSWELALAAYNMGLTGLERAMHKYNTNDYWVLSRLEAGLPFETTQYVGKIMASAIVGKNPGRFGFADIKGAAPFAYDTVEVGPNSSLALIARAAGTDAVTLKFLNPALRRDRTPPDTKITVRIPVGSQATFARAWSRLRRNETQHVTYVVRFGETVASIAKRYRITADALRELNELPEDERLPAGLRIMVPATEPKEAAPEATAEAGGEKPVVAVPDGHFVYAGRTRVFYEVTALDDVDRIAAFFQVTPADIRLWNNVAPDAPLSRGLKLQLFVPASVDLSQAVVLRESDVTVLTVGTNEFFDFHESKQNRVRIRYTLKAGDTLVSLGKRYDLSVGSIGRINGFGKERKLVEGDEIILYVAKDKLPRRAVTETEAATEEAPAEVTPVDPTASPAPEAAAGPSADDAGAAKPAPAENATP